jgi:ATP-dependent Clp protease ATP-binding subunit ClpC
VIVDSEGTGEDTKFTFTGINKPSDVPDAPPVEEETKAGASGATATASSD